LGGAAEMALIPVGADVVLQLCLSCFLKPWEVPRCLGREKYLLVTRGLPVSVNKVYFSRYEETSRGTDTN
jgi:hypothetical protein